VKFFELLFFTVRNLYTTALVAATGKITFRKASSLHIRGKIKLGDWP